MQTKAELLVERIIELLKEKPEEFSSIWFYKEKIEYSIANKNLSILILIKTGEIFKPVGLSLTKQQMNMIKELIKPIIERDEKNILKKNEK